MIMGSSYAPELAEVKKLRDEYKRRFNNKINMFGVNGYEAIYMFKAAFEISGIKNTPDSLQEDRQKFRDALEKTAITSVTGERVKFDEDGDAIKKGYILTIKNGDYQVWDEQKFQ